MNVRQLLPLTFGSGAIVVLAVMGVHADLDTGRAASYLAGSGHGVTATYTTPQAPAMQMGSTVGEKPAPVVTTTTTAAGH